MRNKYFELQSTCNNRAFPRTETIHEDGTVTVLFMFTPELPKLSEVGEFFIRRNCIVNHQEEIGLVIKDKGRKGFFIGSWRRIYMSCGRRVFTRKTWLDAFCYDGKRVTVRKTVNSFYRYLIKALMLYFGLEGCLPEGFDNQPWIDGLFDRVVNNKMVLRAIITEKVTNWKDMFRFWLKSTYQLTGVNYTLIERYLRKVHSYNYDFNLAALRDFTTSVDWSARKVMQWIETIPKEGDTTGYQMVSLFKDLLKDAELLPDYKVNPRWSEKRMKAEHQNNIRKMRLLCEGSFDDEKIYDKDIVIDDEDAKVIGRVIGSEVEAYLESFEQDNCLYTHYYPSIRKGNYLAVSLSSPERCTVGLTVSKSADNKLQLSIEQMRASHNRCLQPDNQKAITAFVNENFKLFTSLVEDRRRRLKPNDGAKVEADRIEYAIYDDIPF